MSEVVLFDGYNICISTLFSNNVIDKNKNVDYQTWKYIVFDKIVGIVNYFKNVDEVIFALDHNPSWRKFYFPRYKESRKNKRDKTINWNEFFQVLEEYKNQLIQYTPFKIIQAKNAEGDDIIAVLSKYINGNKIIVSTDLDYCQLVSKNIRLFNPIKFKLVKCGPSNEWLTKKFLMGQSKDDIFNVKTPNDWPQNKRKPSCGEKQVEKILEYGLEQWIKDNNLKENFKRNQILIDFEYIPNTIKKRIINEYNNYKIPADFDDLYKFLELNNFVYHKDKYQSLYQRLIKLH